MNPDRGVNPIAKLTSGQSVGAIAVVAALGLIGAEMVELGAWSEVSPKFIGEMILQLGPVIAAYIGGTMASKT